MFYKYLTENAIKCVDRRIIQVQFSTVSKGSPHTLRLAQLRPNQSVYERRWRNAGKFYTTRAVETYGRFTPEGNEQYHYISRTGILLFYTDDSNLDCRPSDTSSFHPGIFKFFYQVQTLKLRVLNLNGMR